MISATDSMTEILYRQASEPDFERTYQIMAAATNHLAAAHNFPQEADDKALLPRALAFRRHALSHDAQRFWVAETCGQAIAFGIGILRDHLSYLATLHVLPDYQGRGIGHALVDRCIGHEQTPGARIWMTVADSLNPVAHGLYGQFGMYPWVPLTTLSGPIPKSGITVDEERMRRARRLTSNLADLSVLAGIDEFVLGLRRDLEHQLWLTQEDIVAYLFGDPRNPEGYAYLSTTGVIGPIAVKSESAMESALAFCLAQLRVMGLNQTSVRLPGWCRAGLRYLLNLRFRYGTPFTVLVSEPFGHIECYIPSAGDALF